MTRSKAGLSTGVDSFDRVSSEAIFLDRDYSKRAILIVALIGRLPDVDGGGAEAG